MRELNRVQAVNARRPLLDVRAGAILSTTSLLAIAVVLGAVGTSNAQLRTGDGVEVDVALHRAAHRGDVVALRHQLDKEADPNSVNRFGVTPLALASEGGHFAAVELLLERGANPNQASPSGETPLMVAARTGVIKSVVALLERGANPLSREHWLGQTALMWAVSSGLAWLAFGLAPLMALAVGAAITPTDPVVAASIVTGRIANAKVPARVRHLIQAESAANDGLGFLFVMLPILLLTKPAAEAWGEWASRIVLWEVGGAILIGGIIGWLAGKLFVWAKKKPYSEDESLLTIGLALSLTVLAGLELIGTDGILAVFVAGIMFNRGISDIETHQHNLHGAITRFFDLPVFVLIGVLLPWKEWLAMGWNALFLALALVLLRRLPWWLVLSPIIPSLKKRDETLFAGFFGPIGVAAAYYAMLAHDKTGIEWLWPVASLVIFLSVIIHGISATPLANLLGRRLERYEDEAKG